MVRKLSKKILLFHDIDGRIYFKAIEALSLESGIKLEILFLFPLRKILADIIKRRTLDNLSICLKSFIEYINLFFKRDLTIVIGCKPFHKRLRVFNLLKNRHDLIYHTSWPYWDKFKLKNKNFYDNFKAIVTVLESSERSIRKSIDYRGPIRTIPHVVDLPLFSGIKEIDNKILFVGRLEECKGVEILISFSNSLLFKNYEISVIGKGKLKQKIEDSENIKYFGFIDDKKKLTEIYRNNSFLFVPSIKNNEWEELFGIVIIEAMSQGLIVISSNHIGPRNIITDGVDGFLVDSWEIDKLSSIMKREDLHQISMNAIRASAKFSIKNIKNSWKELFNL